MKNNTSSAESVNPLILKLTLIAGGIIVMIMLVLTVRSIIGIFRSSPSPTTDTQTGAEAVAMPPDRSLETPISSASDNFGAQISPLSVSDSSKPATPTLSQPATFAVQVEIARQREKARTETIEALKREAQEQAGTSEVPKEVLQKLEQSDPIIY